VTATITFPAAEGEGAFVVDGQHRLFSSRDEYRKPDDGVTFELPIVAFHNASEEVVGATFETFPEAWADEKRKTFALLQPSSLQITIALLPDVMQRCDFYKGFSYNNDTLKRQLAPLADIALLNHWRWSSVDEALSTSPRREMFLGQLR
jgi:hypothetical protein